MLTAYCTSKSCYCVDERCKSHLVSTKLHIGVQNVQKRVWTLLVVQKFVEIRYKLQISWKIESFVQDNWLDRNVPVMNCIGFCPCWSVTLAWQMCCAVRISRWSLMLPVASLHDCILHLFSIHAIVVQPLRLWQTLDSCYEVMWLPFLLRAEASARVIDLIIDSRLLA